MRGSGAVVGSGEDEAGQRDGSVDGRGHEGCDLHVKHAQQIETREEAAEHARRRCCRRKKTRATRRRAAWFQPSGRWRAASRPSAAWAAADRRRTPIRAGECRQTVSGDAGHRNARRAAAKPEGNARGRRCPVPARHRFAADGCRFEMRRGSAKLPRHMPPMNVPSRTPSETAEEPMTSCSNCSQTIS